MHVLKTAIFITNWAENIYFTHGFKMNYSLIAYLVHAKILIILILKKSFLDINSKQYHYSSTEFSLLFNTSDKLSVSL